MLLSESGRGSVGAGLFIATEAEASPSTATSAMSTFTGVRVRAILPQTSPPTRPAAAVTTTPTTIHALETLYEPGSKAAFYLNFLDRMAPLLAAHADEEREALSTCSRCGGPSAGEVCSFCRLVDASAAHAPVPVEIVARRHARSSGSSR